ncbi:hypothetical protein RBH29_02030 [Herbivorax sp. ANBcel31]|uniref:hypothetical protein n=1 Tax=Herbivorax sp. ANBcel31 TaxID=3069754 RepID=UPI0027B3C087|nr:hypothetical protein [Herbivorax sp. ANBcel31]MDQ2085214.1 hypothetical protein [Herbivorax sp. ANBcel31]
MSKSLIKKISSDLNIIKFKKETLEEYGNRLIYSALCEWARVQLLGKSYTDISCEREINELDCHDIDIMHVQSNLAKVADGLLLSISCSDMWIKSDLHEEKASKLASKIIKDLIFCNEISQLIDVRRLIISPKRTAAFSKYKLILGGADIDYMSEKICCVGMGRWKQNLNSSENYKKIFMLSEYSAKEYFEKLIINAIWEEKTLDGIYLILSLKQRGWYSKTWIDCNISKLPEGVSLLKNKDFNGGYFLIRNDSRGIKVARIDQWYIDEKELCRIIYSMGCYNSLPAVFNAEICEDHIVLHCNSMLPNTERRLLLMFSWPWRNYNDIHYRIVPKFLWNELKNILNNLGIMINYKNIIRR